MLDEKSVKLRLEKQGGIPRFVLEKIDDADQLFLDKAIARTNIDAIHASIGNVDSADNTSHSIVHMHVG